MTSAEVWAFLGALATLVGVNGTLMFGMHRLMVREMSARFEAVDHRLAALEADLSIIKSALIGQRSV